MRDIPDNYYSLAIVDPPYGINAPKQGATLAQRKQGATRLNGGSGKLKNRTLNTSNINWDNAIPSEEYFLELKRISKNQIIWGGNYFHLPPSRCIICWDKMQPWENFSQIELAWTSFDMPAQIFKFDNRTGDKIHPTQKPVALYKYLLDKYAKPNDKILDTHGGSMSIAIACHDYGFDLDLCELDKEYFDKGVQRVKNHVAQQKLF
jgi:site-specific DNA-methyltransferase (adenine-specific)